MAKMVLSNPNFLLAALLVFVVAILVVHAYFDTLALERNGQHGTLNTKHPLPSLRAIFWRQEQPIEVAMETCHVSPVKDVEVRFLEREEGIAVHIMNDGLNTVFGCELFIADVQEFSPKHQEFRKGQFPHAMRLFARTDLRAGYGTHAVPLVRAVDKYSARIEDQLAGIKPEPFDINASGIWRIVFSLESQHNDEERAKRSEECFFQWQPAGIPRLVGDPRIN